MTVRVTERKIQVPNTAHGRLPCDGADSRADLVLEGDVLVPWALRDEERACSVDIMELVDHHRFEAIFQRL